MKMRLSIQVVLIHLMLASGPGHAQAPKNILDVMRDATVTQEDLAAVIINRDVGTEWIIPALNAPSFDDRATTQSPTTLFARNAAQAMYGTLSKMPVDSLSASDYDAILALIGFRDRLLDAGGSVNVCLAGSISDAIYNMLSHVVCREQAVDIQKIENIIKKNQVSLGRVVASLAKDDRWTTRSVNIDLDASDEDVARQYLAQIGINEFYAEDTEKMWFDAFVKERASMETRFDRSLLKDGDFLSYLALFIALADNQRTLLSIIDYEKVSGKLIREYFSKEIDEASGLPIRLDKEHINKLSEELDVFMEDRPFPVSITKFKPISKDRILNQVFIRYEFRETSDPKYHLVRDLLAYDKYGRSTYDDEKE
jgi:hypothetical protein